MKSGSWLLAVALVAALAVIPAQQVDALHTDDHASLGTLSGFLTLTFSYFSDDYRDDPDSFGDRGIVEHDLDVTFSFSHETHDEVQVSATEELRQVFEDWTADPLGYGCRTEIVDATTGQLTVDAFLSDALGTFYEYWLAIGQPGEYYPESFLLHVPWSLGADTPSVVGGNLTTTHTLDFVCEGHEPPPEHHEEDSFDGGVFWVQATPPEGVSFSGQAESDWTRLFGEDFYSEDVFEDNSSGQIVDTYEESILWTAAWSLTPYPDQDKDGVPNLEDNCLDDFNPSQDDEDSDGQGDACEPPGELDSDGDGVVDSEDNCPEDFNPDQEDTDGNGVGDVCEPPVPPDPYVDLRLSAAWETNDEFFQPRLGISLEVQNAGTEDANQPSLILRIRDHILRLDSIEITGPALCTGQVLPFWTEINCQYTEGQLRAGDLWQVSVVGDTTAAGVVSIPVHAVTTSEDIDPQNNSITVEERIHAHLYCGGELLRVTSKRIAECDWMLDSEVAAALAGALAAEGPSTGQAILGDIWTSAFCETSVRFFKVTSPVPCTIAGAASALSLLAQARTLDTLSDIWEGGDCMAVSSSSDGFTRWSAWLWPRLDHVTSGSPGCVGG